MNTPNTIKAKLIDGTNLVMATSFSKETDKAVLATVINTSCGSNRDYWIPKSLLKIEEYSVVLPLWFVKKTFGYIA